MIVLDSKNEFEQNKFLTWNRNELLSNLKVLNTAVVCTNSGMEHFYIPVYYTNKTSIKLCKITNRMQITSCIFGRNIF